jgi:hypothetical protein
LVSDGISKQNLVSGHDGPEIDSSMVILHHLEIFDGTADISDDIHDLFMPEFLMFVFTVVEVVRKEGL